MGMFTMTSTETGTGEQTPIDQKYRRKSTRRPFAGEEPEVTLSVGNPARELGKGIVPGALSQHDADATHNVQPPTAHEAVAFLRADHRRAELRDAAGRAPRGEVAFAAGNRGRNADLLATLADLTYFDEPTFQQSTDNPLETDGSDLVVLADGNHEIMTLHTTNPAFTPAMAQKLLISSVAKKATSDWWFAGGALYQVAVQPVNRRPSPENNQLGTVVVGREIGYSAVHNLGRTHSAELAFSYGGNVVTSTLGPLDEHELDQQSHDLESSAQIHIANQQFYAISVGLTDGPGPNARLITLKSYNRAAEFLSELNHLLIGLGVLALMTGTWLALIISNTFTRPLANLDRGVQALERGDYG